MYDAMTDLPLRLLGVALLLGDLSLGGVRNATSRTWHLPRERTGPTDVSPAALLSLCPRREPASSFSATPLSTWPAGNVMRSGSSSTPGSNGRPPSSTPRRWRRFLAGPLSGEHCCSSASIPVVSGQCPTTSPSPALQSPTAWHWLRWSSSRRGGARSRPWRAPTPPLESQSK